MRLPSLICGGYFYDINYAESAERSIFASECLRSEQLSNAVEQQSSAESKGKTRAECRMHEPPGREEEKENTRGCFIWPFSPKKLHTKELSTEI